MSDIPAWVAHLYARIKKPFSDERRAKIGSSTRRPGGIHIVEPSRFLYYIVYTCLGLLASFLPMLNMYAPR